MGYNDKFIYKKIKKYIIIQSISLGNLTFSLHKLVRWVFATEVMLIHNTAYEDLKTFPGDVYYVEK